MAPHATRLPREMSTAELLQRIGECPHDIYVEALRRKSARLDACRGHSNIQNRKRIAEVDQFTAVIRTFYAYYEGGTGNAAYRAAHDFPERPSLKAAA